MTAIEYTIDLPDFAGPLDLLLHLIERQELDITVISLYQVTEQYLAQIEKLKGDRIEYLVDFLTVAARLVLIKSRALLPQTPTLVEGEEEEDPAEALVRQLRQYKQFKEAAFWLRDREERGLRTYLRVAPPPKVESMLDLSGITIDTLLEAMRSAIAHVEKRDDSVSLARPRRITIEVQMTRLRSRIKGGQAARFEELLPKKASRIEVAVTLLAVLELIKRHEIRAEQAYLFGPIEISAALPEDDDASDNR